MIRVRELCEKYDFVLYFILVAIGLLFSVIIFVYLKPFAPYISDFFKDKFNDLLISIIAGIIAGFLTGLLTSSFVTWLSNRNVKKRLADLRNYNRLLEARIILSKKICNRKDYEEAMKILRDLDRDKLAEAQYFLGILHRDGKKYYIKKDYKKAEELLKRAVDNGYEEAARSLIDMKNVS